MTIRKASFQTANSHPAEDLRLSLTANLLASTGVTSYGAFAVTANGTPDMSVNVAAGGAHVAGSQTSTQGTYSVYSDATVNLAVSTSNPTNPRIDRVVLIVDDQGGGYGAPTGAGTTTANAAQLVVIAGTPAASPLAPAIPQNAISLAVIAVGAGATSITSGAITDQRTYASALNAPILCTSSTRPSSPVRNMRIYETDTGKELVYYGATTGWQPPWGQPWGAEQRVVRLTTDHTISASPATAVISAPSGTYLANRIYELTFSGTVSNNTGVTCVVDSDFHDGSTTLYAGVGQSIGNLERQPFNTMCYWVPGATVTKTLSVRMVSTSLMTAGSSNGLIAGSHPAHFTIKDIGPATSTPPAS